MKHIERDNYDNSLFGKASRYGRLLRITVADSKLGVTPLVEVRQT
jgi:hypothetical protein